MHHSDRGVQYASAEYVAILTQHAMVLTELLLWPCPLTWLENWLESRAGIEPYQGGFLLHYLDKVIYPDISATTLTITAVIICALNLALYVRQIAIQST